ncbi:MAG: DeoR family transcriptional regulator [Sulfuricurvum sp.]|uniref:HTH domain-containing protein n=1 Tax=Sulfuricurvum sp. TaxID=2025608 RepID=UPI0026040914|nr:HTH domain-containing protein [Sulfuricurvum sp.]MDD2368158.1 DeoR family transcriptional regulator [Sulfuricurvum sp.]MDD5117043.1 DeoR family transcriptional regulator [Sulfuricurvum sp.]
MSENVPINVSKNRLNEIVKMIEKNKEITSIQIAERLKVSDKTIKRDMATLKEQGRLQRVGSLKSGYWEVLNDSE